MSTKIEWTDESWNPIKMRCTKVSPGCNNCYAERLLARDLPGFKGYPEIGQPPVMDYKTLQQPLHWKKPRKIFVESMGDLFHDDVPRPMIDSVLEIIAACPQHTFIALTKRPENIGSKLYSSDNHCSIREFGGGDYLPNLWIGVTAENQRTANERIPILLHIPAAVHFVSVEPMLGPVDLEKNIAKHILIKPIAFLDWVICGPETGPGKRLFDLQWAWSLYDQCRDAGVPFFAKSDDMVAAGFPREWPKTSQISVKGAGNSDILFGSQSKGDRELTDLI